MSVYKRLHQKYGIKVQLNLFYETLNDFNLAQMPNKFKSEWLENSAWLKMSFHSKIESACPYQNATYREVFSDCEKVQREIIRFAGKNCLAKTTTVHCCRATKDGLTALKANGVKGLLGIYGTKTAPRNQYQSTQEHCEIIRNGEIVYQDGIAYANIDIVLNCHQKEEILTQLQHLQNRHLIKVMIHEQYFYSDYSLYQKDFEEKLDTTFFALTKNGFESAFLEDCI